MARIRSSSSAIHAAAAHQQHRRNADAFLINFARQRHRTRAHASDVGMMRAVRHVKCGFAVPLQEDAGDRGDVGKMRSAAEGIVQNRDIAGPEIECLSGALHRKRHGAQMHGHVIAHRHGFALGVVDGAGIIAAFLDIRGKRSLAQHRAHLFGDGDQQMPEQLQFDRVGLSFFATRDIHQETGHLLPTIILGFFDDVAVRRGVGADAPAVRTGFSFSV